MNEKKSKIKYNIGYAVPFFVVMGIITALAWLLPLRPTFSENEKRELTEFPEYNLESLLNGSYFGTIDTWFSDTFTGREVWLSLSEGVRSRYGTGDVTIYGPIHNDPRPVQTRTPEDPVNTGEVDDPNQDEPQGWKGNTVGDDDFINFGTVLQIEDACYEYFYFYQAGAERHARVMTKAQALVGDRARVFCILPPSAICVMFEQSYLDKIGNANVRDVTDFIYDKCVGVNTVDAYSSLLAHNDEYLYFRTDHHWTALGAYYVYEEFCKTAGLTPAKLSDFKEVVYDGFYGTLYSYANRNSLLRADDVHAYVPPGDIEMYITSSSGKKYSADVITDTSQYAQNGKYLCFIQGDNPITEIENKSIEDGKNCLIIKDSFGNCFVPYLTQNYRNVYVVDYRSFRQLDLNGLVDYFKIDDVIFLNNLTLCQADVTASNLEALIGG